MQLPNDRMKAGGWPISTLDITSGAVHALAEFYAHRCVSNGPATRINLLFDYDGPDVTVRSGLPARGRIEFVAKTARRLEIRIPTWVDAETLRLVAGGQERTPELDAGYVRVDDLTPGARGVLSFSVPVRVEKETVDSIEYTTTWIGNQIIEVLPHGSVSPLPFAPE